MPVRQAVYLLLLITGVAGTWYYNLQLLDIPGGLSFDAFISAMYANPYTGTISNDLNFAFLTFLFWMIVEARRLGMKHWWGYLLVSFCVAFAAAFPLFLLMRERRLAELEQ